MALSEEGALRELFGGSLGTGLLVGAGVLVLGPIFAPTIGRVLRPVAKQAIRAGMDLSAGMRELVDESRAELAAAGDVPSGAAPPKSRRSDRPTRAKGRSPGGC